MPIGDPEDLRPPQQSPAGQEMSDEERHSEMSAGPGAQNQDLVGKDLVARLWQLDLQKKAKAKAKAQSSATASPGPATEEMAPSPEQEAPWVCPQCEEVNKVW